MKDIVKTKNMKEIKKDQMEFLKFAPRKIVSRNCVNNSRPSIPFPLISSVMDFYTLNPQISVAKICEIHGISRASFYKYRKYFLLSEEKQEEEKKQEIEL